MFGKVTPHNSLSSFPLCIQIHIYLLYQFKIYLPKYLLLQSMCNWEDKDAWYFFQLHTITFHRAKHVHLHMDIEGRGRTGARDGVPEGLAWEVTACASLIYVSQACHFCPSWAAAVARLVMLTWRMLTASVFSWQWINPRAVSQSGALCHGTALTSQRVAESPDPVPASALCFVWAWGQNQEQVVLSTCWKVVWASRVSKAVLPALRLGLDSQCLTCRSQLPLEDCVADSGQGNPRSLPKGPSQRLMRFVGSLNPNRICAAYRSNGEMGRVANRESWKCFKFAATRRSNCLGLVYLETTSMLEQDQAPESLREFSELESTAITSTYCLLMEWRLYLEAFS